ncbi:MAG: PPC domain-containing DNA-binding protein [candidate division WOR-3 bacterium]
MRVQKVGSYYQLRLERGEEVMATLLDFVRKRRIRSGLVLGLGAAEELVLGCYDLKHKKYLKRRFRAEHEIAALVGNIAWDETEPICHIHAVIGNRQFATYSGHLFEARVAATCEVSILPGQKRLSRSLDPSTGLRFLRL